MDVQLALAIVSFAVSVASLVPLWLVDSQKRRFAMTLGVGTLIATTGTALVEHYAYERQVQRVATAIDIVLGEEQVWTFEDIRHRVSDTDLQIVAAAVARLVANGRIRGDLLQFLHSSGSYHSVRGYVPQPR
jgi:hypothetical protein